MNAITKKVFFLLIYGAASAAGAKELAEKILVYRGTSDASAAVAISQDLFIVADDENNILRVYRIDEANFGAMPVFSYDLTDFLGVEQEYPEADIEGATRIGDRIYWITSHGRNENGKMRPSRYRFFATYIEFKNGSIIIHPVGRPYKNLVQNMLENETLQHLGLDKATQFDAVKLTTKDRKKLAPKEQGLNIEALCSSADGKILYIGFRNPRPKAKALVVPLYNPDSILEKSALPVFGKPILWDLGNFGIRSMEYSNFHKSYFIIAGPYNEISKFALYRWSGKDDEPPRFVRQLCNKKNDFTPEALVPFEKLGKLLILSDDGSLPISVADASECMAGRLNDDGTCPNKFLIDPAKKTFRGIWITP